jgi:hypothetical protein
MNPLLISAGIGFIIWAFFEWMRGWERNRTMGTQHLCMLGLVGLAIMTASLIAFLITKLF